MQSELLPLVRIPDVQAFRARALYDAGFSSLRKVANASPAQIYQALLSKAPFFSKSDGQMMPIISACKSVIEKTQESTCDQSQDSQSEKSRESVRTSLPRSNSCPINSGKQGIFSKDASNQTRGQKRDQVMKIISQRIVRDARNILLRDANKTIKESHITPNLTFEPRNTNHGLKNSESNSKASLPNEPSSLSLTNSHQHLNKTLEVGTRTSKLTTDQSILSTKEGQTLASIEDRGETPKRSGSTVFNSASVGEGWLNQENSMENNPDFTESLLNQIKVMDKSNDNSQNLASSNEKDPSNVYKQAIVSTEKENDFSSNPNSTEVAESSPVKEAICHPDILVNCVDSISINKPKYDCTYFNEDSSLEPSNQSIDAIWDYIDVENVHLEPGQLQLDNSTQSFPVFPLTQNNLPLAMPFNKKSTDYESTDRYIPPPNWGWQTNQFLSHRVLQKEFK